MTKDMPVFPGWGCNGDLVDEVVGELKKRQRGRGDTGNIRRAEQTLAEVKALRSDINKIMIKLDIMEPPTHAVIPSSDRY